MKYSCISILFIYDTVGVHHVHGVPGMVGAGISAITLGVYQLDPINDST